MKTEMRTLLLELRPSTLTEASLGDLLRQLAEAAGGRTGVPVEVSVDERCEMRVRDARLREATYPASRTRNRQVILLQR